jgi:pimeloyl-ACP methyl ester carboxylesterase
VNRARPQSPHEPRLIATRSPRVPKAIVLVLHGGAGRPGGLSPVSSTQPSVLRMIPIARRIATRGRGKLAVYRLLNSARGWTNEPTPVDDARWAIAQLRVRFGDTIPVCLVGHSLGGRAALLTSTSPAVTTCVALNPYLYAEDGQADLSGTRVLVIHGTADRVASPATAERVVDLLRRRTSVALVRVLGGKHAMLSRGRTFDGIAADFVASTLLGTKPRHPLDASATVDV